MSPESEEPIQRSSVRDIADLKLRVEELTDLFRRRLLDDRDKARTVATLQSELEYAREGIRKQVIEPIIRQLILVLDRIDRHRLANGSNTTFEASIAEEILEILGQYGVTRLDHFDVFDPRLSESIRTQNTRDVKQEGRVASVERSAYLWSGELLRPAAVEVYRISSE